MLQTGCQLLDLDGSDTHTLQMKPTIPTGQLTTCTLAMVVVSGCVVDLVTASSLLMMTHSAGFAFIIIIIGLLREHKNN